jgi:hypothetical protein
VGTRPSGKSAQISGVEMENEAEVVNKLIESGAIIPEGSPIPGSDDPAKGIFNAPGVRIADPLEMERIRNEFEL